MAPRRKTLPQNLRTTPINWRKWMQLQRTSAWWPSRFHVSPFGSTFGVRDSLFAPADKSSYWRPADRWMGRCDWRPMHSNVCNTWCMLHCCGAVSCADNRFARSRDAYRRTIRSLRSARDCTGLQQLCKKSRKIWNGHTCRALAEIWKTKLIKTFWGLLNEVIFNIRILQ